MSQTSERVGELLVDVAPCSGEGVIAPLFVVGVIIEAGVIVLTTPTAAL